MFETQFNKALKESTFEEWLENGRNSRVGYLIMLIIWSAQDEDYRPVYVSDRNELSGYRVGPDEVLVAAYDLYSESRLDLRD